MEWLEVDGIAGPLIRGAIHRLQRKFDLKVRGVAIDEGIILAEILRVIDMLTGARAALSLAEIDLPNPLGMAYRGSRGSLDRIYITPEGRTLTAEQLRCCMIRELTHFVSDADGTSFPYATPTALAERLQRRTPTARMAMKPGATQR